MIRSNARTNLLRGRRTIVRISRPVRTIDVDSSDHLTGSHPLSGSNCSGDGSSKPSPIVEIKDQIVDKTNHVNRTVPLNKVSRLLTKIKKESRSDSSDICNPKNITTLEIKEAINLYNTKFQKSLTLEDFRNDDELIQKFLFTRQRPYTEVTVEIIYQSSEGQGYAILPKSIYYNEPNEGYSFVIVPKTIVGDIAKIQLLMHDRYYVESALVSIENLTSRTTKRNNSLIVCDKFNECNGCQLQMMNYQDQLDFKQNLIHKAYRFFYPDIYKQIDLADLGMMVPSPMEYSYRTKITPHYSWSQRQRELGNLDVPIGFLNVNPTKPKVDVDHCAIATRSINQRLPGFKAEIIKDLIVKNPKKYQSTALLRESLRIDFKTGEFDVVALTDPRKIATEKVGDYVFQFPANEFFQNNNSILPVVLDFIKFNLEDVEYKNIVDTYCGSGFFGISLSSLVPKGGKVFGIEASKNSIKYASHNAKINGIEGKIEFLEGQADSIFRHQKFRTSKIKGDDSIVIMDPSRKGSSPEFLSQLFEFKPKLIIYISCNVFSQARDLNTFKSLSNDEYKIRTITGFDFFPQTKHVESIAILELV